MHTFLAMIFYPNVQVRARHELETALGVHHLPTFEDFGSMPYIDALIKGLLRWQPIVPLGKSSSTLNEQTICYYVYTCRFSTKAARGRQLQWIPFGEGLPGHREYLVSLSAPLPPTGASALYLTRI